MKIKRLISLVLATAMVATMFAACGKKEAPKTAATEGTTLTVALGSDIVALDPAFAYDFTTNPVVNQVTEGLLTFDENNQLVPQLAKSWEIVDDVTYKYVIRDDVKFSDGTPMTMEDVLFSLERTKNPDVASYLGWMFGSVESIKQTGDWEITVKLKQPDATWQYVPGTTAGHIISKAYYEAHKDTFGTAEGGLMGTGPYKYSSWKSGTEIVLDKNENYRDAAKIEVSKLIFKIIPEDTTRVTAMQTEQVDFTAEPPLDMLKTLRDSGKVNLDSVETMGISYLAFNTQKAPFDDVNVRKEIYHAINFKPLYENIIKEAGIPATVLPHGKSLYTIEPERWAEYEKNAPKYEYNLEKAKEYMAKSSVPNGFDCNLMITESSLSYSKGLAVQEALKALNINVEWIKLSSEEHTKYQFGNAFDADGKRDYDMIIAGWEADYPDISGNIEPLYAKAN
ncbi:MAG: ABC transporter substrate-binding protein, partial [Oscillospiraceae bacterium]